MDMTADTPTGSAAGPVPGVALGHGFTPAAFAPGRYATAIQRTMHGTHALQVLKEDSTAAFTLQLAANGTATAPRGWHHVVFAGVAFQSRLNFESRKIVIFGNISILVIVS